MVTAASFHHVQHLKGICNLFMAPVLACLLFMKDTVGLLRPPTNAGKWDISLMSIQGAAHALMNHLACETTG